MNFHPKFYSLNNGNLTTMVPGPSKRLGGGGGIGRGEGEAASVGAANKGEWLMMQWRGQSGGKNYNRIQNMNVKNNMISTASTTNHGKCHDSHHWYISYPYNLPMWGVGS